MTLRKAYRLFRRAIKPIHKYGVPFLFILSCFFSINTYSEWYHKWFTDIEYWSTMGIIPCLIMFVGGFVHNKCNWFKCSSFGLLWESTFNYLEHHNYTDGIYIALFRYGVLTISLIAVIYYFHFEFKGCKYDQ